MGWSGALSGRSDTRQGPLPLSSLSCPHLLSLRLLLGLSVSPPGTQDVSKARVGVTHRESWISLRPPKPFLDQGLCCGTLILSVGKRDTNVLDPLSFIPRNHHFLREWTSLALLIQTTEPWPVPFPQPQCEAGHTRKKRLGVREQDSVCSENTEFVLNELFW